MPEIHISNIDDGFIVWMFDDFEHGHMVMFNCSVSELQVGIKKALGLFKEKQHNGQR